MLFGIYLVENGVITCEEFFEALKLQLRTRPQIGGLAIETRKLTAKQVFTILRKQCDAPADMFGELAVKLGFLSKGELGELIHEQSVRLKPFSELLVETGILSPATVERHSRDYRWTMEQVESGELTTANI
jgi:hypothetical protein